DSRCYLLSGDRFDQLTEDHSLVQKMVNTGNLSRAEARIHPYRNVIYRSIGADEQVEIDIVRRRLTSGDTLMLCSDGLNGMLSDDQIRDIMMVNPDPNWAAMELVVAAYSAGGYDNNSVSVGNINCPPPPTRQSSDEKHPPGVGFGLGHIGDEGAMLGGRCERKCGPPHSPRSVGQMV